MSPAPALATEWETSDDGLTWTFTMRDDAMWSDGEPLTAADVAYTYGRILDGGPEAATWSSYLKGVESVEAPDATTVVLTLKKPNAVLPLLPIPIVPEHIWKDVSEKDIKSYAAEPTDGQPVVGSGPVPAGRGHRRRLDLPVRGQPRLLERRAARRRGGLPGLQERGPGGAGADQGRGRLRRQPLGAPGRSRSRARRASPRSNGDSPGFDEIAFNTGSVDLETGEPIGDPNPAVLDPAFRFALNFAIDREQLLRTVYQGGGKTGTTIIPPAYPRLPAGAADDPTRSPSTSTRPASCSTRPATPWAPTASARCRTATPSARCGSPRAATRRRPSDVMQFFQEWLGELGIDAEVETYESSKLTERHPRRQLRRLRVGLVRRARPRLDARAT